MGTDRQAKDDASEQVHKATRRIVVPSRRDAVQPVGGPVEQGWWFTSLDVEKARRTMLVRLCVFPASEHRTDVAFCF